MEPKASSHYMEDMLGETLLGVMGKENNEDKEVERAIRTDEEGRMLVEDITNPRTLKSQWWETLTCRTFWRTQIQDNLVTSQIL